MIVTVSYSALGIALYLFYRKRVVIAQFETTLTVNMTKICQSVDRLGSFSEVGSLGKTIKFKT